MPQMRSRREQVDAHRFITSRMNQALVLANPDSVERPLRRIGVSIFASVMIMILVFGGFAIAALLNKGNQRPEVGNIIIEKGTNAIYVYTWAPDAEEQGEAPKLWPVANFTSALLLLDPQTPYRGDPPVQNLKPESLVGYPRGFLIGIDGAPPSPPDAESLLQHENWNACSMGREVRSKPSHMLTQLVVEDLPEPEWLGDDQWLLAETAVPDDEAPDLYLLWNDRKYPVTDEQVLTVLNLRRDDAIPLNEDMLRTIVSGAPLEAVTENYFGDESTVEDPDVGVLTYGQTYEAGGDLFVLLRDDDLGDEFARISETQELLLRDANGSDSITISTSVKNETGAQARYGSDDFPTDTHELWTVDTDRPAVCAVFDPDLPADEAKIAIALYSTAPGTLTDAAESVDMSTEGDIVSNVEGQTAQTVLPPGTAALISAQSSPGQTLQGMTYLVDSIGYSYGIVDFGRTGSTKSLLGYGDVESVGVPDTMRALIPQGPSLDPSEARKQLNPESDDIPTFDTGEEEGGGE
ncbi:type VII secretion protein EccB [Glycomyces sp. L485]|uniref:type VII secretion protein EccB n=1 Tax=Glycomyces sp. L485 TaxID=2909235 RepID=UPI001F4B40DA|nr:type VII secretion protein EccB [Glycomyces sp. L485]MCH7232601.1 type VII secretion protein EccB [Glycomyces sp. L485]